MKRKHRYATPEREKIARYVLAKHRKALKDLAALAVVNHVRAASK